MFLEEKYWGINRIFNSVVGSLHSVRSVAVASLYSWLDTFGLEREKKILFDKIMDQGNPVTVDTFMDLGIKEGVLKEERTINDAYENLSVLAGWIFEEKLKRELFLLWVRDYNIIVRLWEEKESTGRMVNKLVQEVENMDKEGVLEDVV